MSRRKESQGRQPRRIAAIIDAALFARWSSGDRAARDEAWKRVWTTMMSYAIAIAQGFVPDRPTAEEWGADAVTQTLIEFEQNLVKGFSWRGEAQFVGIVVTRVRQRILDRYRVLARDAIRTDDLDRDDNEARLGAALRTPPNQRAAAPAVARTRDAIEGIVSRLAGTREICGKRKALVDVVSGDIQYVHSCCARAVSGVETTNLSLDDIVLCMDCAQFEASEAEMNQFVMASLGIDRNTLYLRRREIRKLLDKKGRTMRADECDVAL
jgi:hypothetical protein